MRESVTFLYYLFINMDSETFPKNFPDIGSWAFKRVWDERRDFCKFSLDWSNPTGIFEKFQNFCQTPHTVGNIGPTNTEKYIFSLLE